ncbi:hypothetical protein QTP86_012243 [Hemibagrus guttatus]|nr:hypothetical protein QTP86_012243 [Hemibagrus guttatus]
MAADIKRFSKSCWLVSLPGPPTALETAECLFNHVFRYYGLPDNIVSDRGPQFTSRVWRAFCKCLGVTVSLSLGYHPQTNGQTERKIQEIGRFLRTFCHSHQESWNQFLGWAEYAQNSLQQSTTGLTPFQCVLGYQPPLFPWDGEPSDVPAVDYWFQESERVWGEAHLQLQRALHRRRATLDLRRSQAPEYQPGQKVWLSTRDIKLRLPCRKLSPRFIGPFTIVCQINPVTYRLQLPPEYKMHPVFHVSLLKPHHSSVLPSTEPGAAEEPPLPLLVDDGTAYLVKEILDSWCRGGRLEYLVDWEGYGPEEWSWVPRDNILDPGLHEDFHASHPDRLAPWGRVRGITIVRSKELSEAFRKKIVDAYESGKGYKKISKEFVISHSTVHKIIYKWRTFKTTANMARTITSPGLWRHPGARPRVGARRRVPGGRVFACGTRPGTAQRKDVGSPSRRPTNRRKEHKGPVQCVLCSSHGRGPRRPKPWTKNLAFGTWNVTSLEGKEPELVREVERYWLEIVGLASTHSLGSGTQLLERGWTLFFSGVPHGERSRAGVGLLIARQLSRHVLEFSPVNERVVSLRLRAGG